MKETPLYRNLWLYRLAMQFLYRSRYRTRFSAVCRQFLEADRTILELCFGDTVVADYCRQHNLKWIGLDASGTFVAHALRHGHAARREDIREAEFPACDTCVMMGSLYHFHDSLTPLFRRIKAASSRWILSEPVRNWMHGPRPLSLLARRLTRGTTAYEAFRFNRASLIEALQTRQEHVGFTYRILEIDRDMLVEVLWSK